MSTQSVRASQQILKNDCCEWRPWCRSSRRCANSARNQRDCTNGKIIALAPTHHEIRYDGIYCTLQIQPRADRVIVLRITGSDIGEFGDAPMKAMSRFATAGEPIDLFIDARDVRGASIEVSGDWAAWLGANRTALASITMLTGSRFIQMTAEFVRRFASLEKVMHICTEPAVFDHVLAARLRIR